MLFVCQPQQICSQQRPTGQRERLAGFCHYQSPDSALAFGFREATYIRERQVQAHGRGDNLGGPPGMSDEGGAQAVMPAHEGTQGLFQGSPIENPAQADHGGDVVGGVAGLQLVQKPELFLGEGKGNVSIAGWQMNSRWQFHTFLLQQSFQQLPPLTGEMGNRAQEIVHYWVPPGTTWLEKSFRAMRLNGPRFYRRAALSPGHRKAAELAPASCSGWEKATPNSAVSTPSTPATPASRRSRPPKNASPEHTRPGSPQAHSLTPVSSANPNPTCSPADAHRSATAPVAAPAPTDCENASPASLAAPAPAPPAPPHASTQPRQPDSSLATPHTLPASQPRRRCDTPDAEPCRWTSWAGHPDAAARKHTVLPRALPPPPAALPRQRH